MGTSPNQPVQSLSDFQEQLIYIESAQSSQWVNLGTIQIYRFKQPPYQYIMKYQKKFMLQDPSCAEYISLVRSLSNRINHRNLAKIHYIHDCEGNLFLKPEIHMCIKNVKLTTYVNYYTFSLQQILTKRKLQDTRFTPNQLWYIACSLIDVGGYLQQLGLSYGSFSPANINVSPQGYIKIYLHHISTNNRHTPYYSILSDPVNVSKCYALPPQYLHLLHSNFEYTFKPDLYAADAFAIGMTLLHLMQDQSPTKYYLFIGNEIVFDRQAVAEDIRKLRPIYPQSLIVMVERLLEEDPKIRWRFTHAMNHIQSIRDDISISGCIKMLQDEDNPIVPKLSFNPPQNQQVLKELIINSFANYLEVIPIRAISNQQSTRQSSQSDKLGVSLICNKNIQHKPPVPKLSRLSSIDSKTTNTNKKMKIRIMFPR